MTKKKPSAIASAITATSIKSKKTRTKNYGMHARKGTAGLLTVHHPEGVPAKAGMEERRAVLKWRAMELKMQGMHLRQIALQLQEDFELEKPPGFNTVDDWLDEAFAEAMTAKQKDADRHCSVILMRAEAIISRLFPLAMGNLEVRRTRHRDGQEIVIIDERAFQETIAASAEMRKWTETTAKLLKIGRVGEGTDADGNTAQSGHGLTVLIEKTVTNNINFPGQTPKAPVTLVLESGDVDIDKLDAAALSEHPSHPEPI